ncbi:[Fe-Fe] hydrogenase large subunit C-terminal domain-containing protein [Haloimpatiens lingqiaonensis]|uniref:[Fe-Fe] hydrogenase large subunit C-terminal domain-containing protein n=1 Tax=Haloimpatiens lingqiaonensis TaxID=1380675 RepID=UPI0010FD139A|nr:[Fe-Fe] hydrogenase large subunit C-terminal domain-containing protein [Haloimpatiens lingqiaonensis]
MKEKYKDLFKRILWAKEEGNFKSEVGNILKESGNEKKKLSKVISSLCGVTVEYIDDENFINSLESAMKGYERKAKIVHKIGECTMECADEEGKTLCQKACPFNAILNEENKIYINEDLCTDCGRCVTACENGGYLDRIEFMPLVDILKSDVPVIAAVAPAIAGQFGRDVSLEKMRTAFKKVGFSDMVEVAFFADMLTLKEAIEFDAHVKSEKDIMITSCCCPMWVGMLKRVYKDLVKDVSPSVSPMIAAGRVLKKLNPNCKVVFVGPCIAKKAEAKNEDIKGAIDFVLTFEEVKGIFEVLDINPSGMEEDFTSEYASREGRLYARTGGVSIAVSEAIETLFPERKGKVKTAQAHGVKECKEILDKAVKGEIDANFIEGMGCIGGCVGGPKALIPAEEGKKIVDETAENSKVRVSLNNECMNEVLKLIGIDGVEDFKNKEKIQIFEREF